LVKLRRVVVFRLVPLAALLLLVGGLTVSAASADPSEETTTPAEGPTEPPSSEGTTTPETPPSQEGSKEGTKEGAGTGTPGLGEVIETVTPQPVKEVVETLKPPAKGGTEPGGSTAPAGAGAAPPAAPSSGTEGAPGSGAAVATSPTRSGVGVSAKHAHGGSGGRSPSGGRSGSSGGAGGNGGSHGDTAGSRTSGGDALAGSHGRSRGSSGSTGTPAAAAEPAPFLDTLQRLGGGAVASAIRQARAEHQGRPARTGLDGAVAVAAPPQAVVPEPPPPTHHSILSDVPSAVSRTFGGSGLLPVPVRLAIVLLVLAGLVFGLRKSRLLEPGRR
jgi:hypothetical protein